MDSLQGLAGVRATYIAPMHEGRTVKVTGYAVYSHEFEDTSRRINVQLAGAPNAPFIIAGVSPGPGRGARGGERGGDAERPGGAFRGLRRAVEQQPDVPDLRSVR